MSKRYVFATRINCFQEALRAKRKHPGFGYAGMWLVPAVLSRKGCIEFGYPKSQRNLKRMKICTGKFIDKRKIYAAIDAARDQERAGTE